MYMHKTQRICVPGEQDKAMTIMMSLCMALDIRARQDRGMDQGQEIRQGHGHGKET